MSLSKCIEVDLHEQGRYIFLTKCKDNSMDVTQSYEQMMLEQLDILGK